MTPHLDPEGLERANKTWTPEQFFQFLEGYVGEFECGQIKDVMQEKGLSLVSLGEHSVVVPRDISDAKLNQLLMRAEDAPLTPLHRMFRDFYRRLVEDSASPAKSR